MDNTSTAASTDRSLTSTGPLNSVDALILRWFPLTDISRLTSLQRRDRLQRAYDLTDSVFEDNKMVNKWLVTTRNLFRMHIDMWRLNVDVFEFELGWTVPQKYRELNNVEVLGAILPHLCLKGTLSARRARDPCRAAIVTALKHHPWQRLKSGRAVEYCDAIEDLQPLPAGALDIVDALKADGEQIEQGSIDLRSHVPIYIPGRISAAHHLPPLLRSYIEKVHGEFNHQQRVPKEPTASAVEKISRWLDFSQFSLNPFFESTCDGRIKLVNGRYEISLCPNEDMGCRLFDPISRKDAEINELVARMQVADPRCKTIGIYEPMRNVSRSERTRMFWGGTEWVLPAVRYLNRIHNPNGITVGELTKSLRQLEQRVIDSWLMAVTELSDMEGVKSTGATDTLTHSFQSRFCRDNFFSVSANPKILLFLDNKRMYPGVDIRWHSSRASYLGDVYHKVGPDKVE